jgi:mannose-6-phosphate isomerase-like protein (cupin superfamily)
MAYIDPTKAAPNNYKLLFEDDTHRVVEMSLKAGQKDNEHSHTAEVVYFISGGSAKISMPDGQSMEAEIPDGHVMAHEAWTHTVENTADKDIKAIIFETK